MILRKPYTHKIDIWGLGILLLNDLRKSTLSRPNTIISFIENEKANIFSKAFTEDEIELVHKILKVNP